MKSQPPPLPDSVSYETRLTLFDKVRNFSIEGTHLRIEEEEGHNTEIALNDIVDVRCHHFPTRAQLNRYECLLKTKGGLKIKTGNQFFRGVADFEDRSSGYRKFIIDLHVALSKHNPNCVFHSGVTPASFYLTITILALIILTLIILIIVAGATMPAIAVLEFVIAIAMIPMTIKWCYRNKPKNYRVHAIPTEVFPAK